MPIRSAVDSIAAHLESSARAGYRDAVAARDMLGEKLTEKTFSAVVTEQIAARMRGLTQSPPKRFLRRS